MEDPRSKEILDRQAQSIMRKIDQLKANKVTSEDKRKQAIDARDKKVFEKRKGQQQGIGSELIGLNHSTAQKNIRDDLEEHVALQRALGAMKPHMPSNVKVLSTDAPHVAGPPGSNKGLPSLYECARRLKSQTRLICYMGSLYSFNGKCYDYLSPSDVIQLYRKKVDDQLGGERNLRNIRQLHDYLCTDSSIQVDEIEGNQRIAVLKNGVFDIENGKLQKHSDKKVVFSYVKANYVESGSCRCFHQFLECITHGDEVLQERLWQFLGYMLMQTTEGKVFFVMGLAQDSGKSVMGNFIEGLFDVQYVSNVALNDFGRNFALAPIVGSAINISLDLPATKLKPSAVSQLKMLTGGDTFTVSQKYMPEFSYRNRAKFLFATNFPIELCESDDAFWRRVVFLPFDYSISRANQNPDLLDMLRQEKDAIVSEALWHAKTLIDNNFVFPSTSQIERRIEEWQGHANPSIENFLRDCCLINENCRGELTKTLFSAYAQYCESSGYVARNWSFFKHFLENDVGLKHRKMRDGGENPQSAFRGIQLMGGYYDE